MGEVLVLGTKQCCSGFAKVYSILCECGDRRDEQYIHQEAQEVGANLWVAMCIIISSKAAFEWFDNCLFLSHRYGVSAVCWEWKKILRFVYPFGRTFYVKLSKGSIFGRSYDNTNEYIKNTNTFLIFLVSLFIIINVNYRIFGKSSFT